MTSSTGACALDRSHIARAPRDTESLAPREGPLRQVEGWQGGVVLCLRNHRLTLAQVRWWPCWVSSFLRVAGLVGGVAGRGTREVSRRLRREFEWQPGPLGLSGNLAQRCRGRRSDPVSDRVAPTRQFPTAASDGAAPSRVRPCGRVQGPLVRVRNSPQASSRTRSQKPSRAPVRAPRLRCPPAPPVGGVAERAAPHLCAAEATAPTDTPRSLPAGVAGSCGTRGAGRSKLGSDVSGRARAAPGRWRRVRPAARGPARGAAGTQRGGRRRPCLRPFRTSPASVSSTHSSPPPPQIHPRPRPFETELEVAAAPGMPDCQPRRDDHWEVDFRLVEAATCLIRGPQMSLTPHSPASAGAQLPPASLAAFVRPASHQLPAPLQVSCVAVSRPRSTARTRKSGH